MLLCREATRANSKWSTGRGSAVLATAEGGQPLLGSRARAPTPTDALTSPTALRLPGLRLLVCDRGSDHSSCGFPRGPRTTQGWR